MKLVIASNNKGKIAEYKQMLSPLGYEVMSQSETGITLDAEETGSTFEENAAIKARALFEAAHCNVLADDSGLVIDALGGQPGVYSARYGGVPDSEGRNALVLEKMKDVPESGRTARFVAVIHFIFEDGREVSVRGECEGSIGYAPQGDNGFGYDPIFMYEGKSFAQHTQQFKNSVSHRGRALEKLIAAIKKENEEK